MYVYKECPIANGQNADFNEKTEKRQTVQIMALGYTGRKRKPVRASGQSIFEDF